MPWTTGQVQVQQVGRCWRTGSAVVFDRHQDECAVFLVGGSDSLEHRANRNLTCKWPLHVVVSNLHLLAPLLHGCSFTQIALDIGFRHWKDTPPWNLQMRRESCRGYPELAHGGAWAVHWCLVSTELCDICGLLLSWHFVLSQMFNITHI